MSVHTRSQRLAQKAYACVEVWKKNAKDKDFDEYSTFARKFPALVHACGLAQAVAFARAKRSSKKEEGGVECRYLTDLAAVLTAGGHESVPGADALADLTRSAPVPVYLRLTRDALDAAVWLKRYVEAVAADKPAGENG